ncbi:MAG: DUF5104 domain-containing protein [Ruminococcus sp.]|nr:DUF5104 domain-containing protein [Ruminococcus sp.]
MKKRIINLMIVIIIMLSSCGKISDNKTPDQQALEVQNQIMECFVNEDKETIKTLFSEDIIQKNDIDSQIEDAFEYIDSEIISYDEPKTGETGNIEKKDYGARTTNIITKNGTKYCIGFKGWYSYNEIPEKVGVYCIAVYNETLEDSLSKEQKNDESNYSVIIGSWEK